MTNALSAKIFVSSTFRDMQHERDILARLVFPRLREVYFQRLDSLIEVDLRWGITRAMAADEAAARICLEELEACSPLVFAMLGHRIGWRPSLMRLATAFDRMPEGAGDGASMTELEVRFAAELADTAPPVLLRSDRLTKEIGEEVETDGGPSFRDELRTWPNTKEYDDFEVFEKLAQDAIDASLSRWLAANPAGQPGTRRQFLDRPDDLRKIRKSGWRSRSKLIFSPGGAGTTSLIKRHLEMSEARYVDGRALGDGGYPFALGAAKGADNMGAAVIAALAATSVVIDHFEEGFSATARAGLAPLPLVPPRGREMIVVTHRPRLRDEAARAGWRVVEIEPPPEREALDYAAAYLKRYSKVLSGDQRAALAKAPWLRDLKTLNLVLDELRRFGAEETLTARVRALAALSGPVQVAEDVVAGVCEAMPDDHADLPRKALIAIGLSLRGLTPEAARSASGCDGAPAPAHLWSAAIQNLSAGLGERAGRIDLSTGWFAEWLSEEARARPELVRDVGRALIDWLETASPKDAKAETPRILSQISPPEEFINRLAELDFALSVEEAGPGYLASWLTQIGAEAAMRVADAWRDALTGSKIEGAAWRLAEATAAADLRGATVALLEIDAEEAPQRRERSALIAWATGDTAALRRLADEFAGVKREADLFAAIVLIGASVERRIETTEPARRRWTAEAIAFAAAIGRSRDLSVLHRFRGQDELLGGDPRAAAAEFETAEAHARAAGDATALCRALDRRAAAALELNRFSDAQSWAENCLSEAADAGLDAEEHRAFESLIDCARRRADWPRAYQVTTDYLQRCESVIGDLARARRALDELERAKGG
ncbi:MAG: DUF4062 domain-containing protein [Pseudomonadota bacterium]